ncbi:PTS mannitol transporter subunit IICB [Actinotalea lenta]|uniref:PTS mannitol transporter subunit IICB n=1 Tax=Actinotalea lenta TaxID=3064654 RepID=UPI003312FB3E
MSAYTPTVTGTGVKATVQRFGGYLAGMVMPNIGAFIAWGLITAFFIKTGWTPVAAIGGFEDAAGTAHTGLVGPMITYLLPLLIGYTGGKMVHGTRGGVVGAIATVGVIIGSSVPMFLGAMGIGPLTAWVVKKLDEALAGRVKAGFEMLIDNFSAGIISGAMAIFGLYIIGPIVNALTTAAGNGVQWLVDHSLLPLASLIIEPAKVLFLNNAINHGVLDTIGVVQAQDAGKSIMFMLETNPGPGLGVLLAIMFFGPVALRPSAPGAIIIHFFGGIHEIYFPYILMKPQLIAATILGGMAGVFTAVVTGAGLVASPSPGSIFAYFAMLPKSGVIGPLLAVLVATVVSFLVAAPLLGFRRKEKSEADLEAAQAEVAARKSESKGAAAAGTATA